MLEHGDLGAVRLDDLELGNVEAGERDPEGTVRGEGGRTESVTAGPLLDTSNELGETTVGESEAKNNVGDGNALGVQVEEREHKGGTAKAGNASSASRVRVCDSGA